MSRRDPKGAKRRFHVWLYDADIDLVRDHFGGKLTVNEIVREMLHTAANRIRQRVQDEVRETPVDLKLQIEELA